MVLIRRYAASSEYAAMFSTARHRHKEGGSLRSSRATTWLSKHADRFTNETISWFDAFCPSLSDVQAVLIRMRADPDLSQKAVYDFCVPLLVFGCILAICLVTLRLSTVHDAVVLVLGDASHHKVELVLSVLVLVIGMGTILGALRLCIWSGATLVGMFIEKDLKRGENSGSPDLRDQLTKTNVLIGGLA